jgi:hypothetical protein
MKTTDSGNNSSKKPPLTLEQKMRILAQKYRAAERRRQRQRKESPVLVQREMDFSSSRLSNYRPGDSRPLAQVLKA